jgi:hypothetical protein
MRSKRQHPLTIVLAFLCGLFAVAAPVVPQVHQTYARHRHVFCFTDQRVEDAESVDTSVWSAIRLSALDSPAKISAISGAAASLRDGIECLSSNFSAHVVFKGRESSPPRSELPEATVRPMQFGAFSTVEPLRIAPKTSPPVAA